MRTCRQCRLEGEALPSGREMLAPTNSRSSAALCSGTTRTESGGRMSAFGKQLRAKQSCAAYTGSSAPSSARPMHMARAARACRASASAAAESRLIPSSSVCVLSTAPRRRQILRHKRHPRKRASASTAVLQVLLPGVHGEVAAKAKDSSHQGRIRCRRNSCFPEWIEVMQE